MSYPTNIVRKNLYLDLVFKFCFIIISISFSLKYMILAKGILINGLLSLLCTGTAMFFYPDHAVTFLQILADFIPESGTWSRSNDPPVILFSLLQTIAFLAHLKEKGDEGPHLIIVPSSTLGNTVPVLEA
jgi:hypothetical protein